MKEYSKGIYVKFKPEEVDILSFSKLFGGVFVCLFGGKFRF